MLHLLELRSSCFGCHRRGDGDVVGNPIGRKRLRRSRNGFDGMCTALFVGTHACWVTFLLAVVAGHVHEPSFDTTVFCVVGSRLFRKESPAPCALLRHVASFPFGLVAALVVTVVVGPI